LLQCMTDAVTCVALIDDILYVEILGWMIIIGEVFVVLFLIV